MPKSPEFKILRDAFPEREIIDRGEYWGLGKEDKKPGIFRNWRELLAWFLILAPFCFFLWAVIIWGVKGFPYWKPF